MKSVMLGGLSIDAEAMRCGRPGRNRDVENAKVAWNGNEVKETGDQLNR